MKKKKGKEAELIKETSFAEEDTLNRDVKGSVIRWIGKDYDRALIVVVLDDGRILGFTSLGVMVFASRDAYEKYGKQIIKEIMEDEKKLVN